MEILVWRKVGYLLYDQRSKHEGLKASIFIIIDVEMDEEDTWIRLLS